MHLRSTLEQWLAGLGASAWPFLVIGWLSVIAAGHRGGHCHSMFITYKNKIYWLVKAKKKPISIQNLTMARTTMVIIWACFGKSYLRGSEGLAPEPPHVHLQLVASIVPCDPLCIG